MCHSGPVRPILAVLAAAFCFSTTGTAAALAGVDASPVAVGAARILVGGAVLAPLALARGTLRSKSVSGRSGWLISLAAIGVLAYQPAFFLGTQLNGVAIGTVVALGSTPVVAGVLDGLSSRRPPTRGWLVATGLAILGMVLISGLVTPTQAGEVDPLGVLASVGAGASFAVYTLASKALLRDGWRSSEATGAVFGLAALISLPVLLAAGAAWLATPSGLLLAGWLGLITTALAYSLFGWGLARLPVTTAATLALAEPLSAALLGLLLLHEQLTGLAVVGLVLIAVGLAVLALPARRGQVPVSAV